MEQGTWPPQGRHRLREGLNPRHASWYLATLGVVVLASACTSAPDDTRVPGSDSTASATPIGRPEVSDIAPPELIEPGPAQATLMALPLSPRVVPREVGYLRNAFGTNWIDTDGNGCNQRDDVLLRDGTPGTVLVVTQGTCDHDVVAGNWVDPYTGKELVFGNLKDRVQAQGIQIDHVVPLAEAWVSGAAEWPEARRKAFANDLDALLAVDGPTNASKGDGDPAAWRPKKKFQCAYARRWIGIKAAWNLAVDESERRALSEMLSICRGR
ncbi:MAG: HNH endonuclease family protein [Nocardioidaceae bacterium]